MSNSHKNISTEEKIRRYCRNSIERDKPFTRTGIGETISEAKALDSNSYNMLKSLAWFGMKGKQFEYLDCYYPLEAGTTVEDLLSQDLKLANAYIMGYMTYVEKNHNKYLEALEMDDAAKHDIDRFKSEFNGSKQYLKELKARFLKSKETKKSRKDVLQENNEDDLQDF